MPPYTCQICRKSYTRYDSLSRHVRARHSEKEDDDYEQGAEESDVKRLKDTVSLKISIVIDVDKTLGLVKAWCVILCEKRETRKIIIYLNSLNVCIV